MDNYTQPIEVATAAFVTLVNAYKVGTAHVEYRDVWFQGSVNKLREKSFTARVELDKVKISQAGICKSSTLVLLKDMVESAFETTHINIESGHLHVHFGGFKPIAKDI